jgi:hypothetical protein
MKDRNDDNKNIIQFYCRVEVFCSSKIELSELNRGKCFAVKDEDDYNQKKEYDVFAREFYDYDSVINCLYKIESAWKILQKGIERADNCMGCGASVMIYNQWMSELYIGMYNDRWFLSHLSEYTNEWKENYAIDIKTNSESSVVLHIPFYQDENTDEFISKQRVCALLKEWLETNKRNVDFDGSEKIAYMEKILKLNNLW